MAHVFDAGHYDSQVEGKIDVAKVIFSNPDETNDQALTSVRELIQAIQDRRGFGNGAEVLIQRAEEAVRNAMRKIAANKTVRRALESGEYVRMTAAFHQATAANLDSKDVQDLVAKLKEDATARRARVAMHVRDPGSGKLYQKHGVTLRTVHDAEAHEIARQDAFDKLVVSMQDVKVILQSRASGVDGPTSIKRAAGPNMEMVTGNATGARMWIGEWCGVVRLSDDWDNLSAVSSIVGEIHSKLVEGKWIIRTTASPTSEDGSGQVDKLLMKENEAQKEMCRVLEEKCQEDHRVLAEERRLRIEAETALKKLETPVSPTVAEPPAQGNEPPPVALSEVTNDVIDPEFLARLKKMNKVGSPLVAIANIIRKDGIYAIGNPSFDTFEDIIESLSLAPKGGAARDAKAKSTPKQMWASVLPIIPDPKADMNGWTEVADLPQETKEELERGFSVPPVAPVTKDEEESPNPETKKESDGLVFDQKRMMNAETIFKAKLNKVPASEIRDTLITQTNVGSWANKEGLLDSLIEFFPTPLEIKEFIKHLKKNTKLIAVEEFAAQLSDIPRGRERLQLFIFQREAQGALNRIAGTLATFEDGVATLRNASDFHSMLGITLFALRFIATQGGKSGTDIPLSTGLLTKLKTIVQKRDTKKNLATFVFEQMNKLHPEMMRPEISTNLNDKSKRVVVTPMLVFSDKLSLTAKSAFKEVQVNLQQISTGLGLMKTEMDMDKDQTLSESVARSHSKWTDEAKALGVRWEQVQAAYRELVAFMKEKDDIKKW